MSSQTYLTALAENLAETSNRLRTCLDPVQKEKRTYPVVPSPELCRDIASSLINRGFDNFPGRDRYIHGFESKSGAVSWRTEEDFRTPSSRAADVFMAPIYHVLGPLSAERELADSPLLLPVKTSTRTMIKGISMRDHIAFLMRSARRESVLRSLTFRDVVRSADIKTYNQLFGSQNEVSNQFIDDITNIALKGNFEVRDVIEEIRNLSNIYDRTTELRLQTKTYIARADIRAYYVDKDPIRHLAASIVQAILQGPAGYLQGFKAINQVLPPMAKNIVEWNLKVEPHEVLHIVTGDLSSFTNSNVNTWVLALAIYHSLMLKGLENFDNPILANVSGDILEFSILDVLRTFLFLTVGATAKIGEETFVAPGGYLGVKANMRLTCLSFVACLRELEFKVQHMFGVSLFSQIGGDDFLLGLIGTSDKVSLAVEYIRRYISLYVGSLKEFSIAPISEMPIIDGYTGLTFCKKNLCFSRLAEPGLIRIWSIRKLPIMSQLVEHEVMKKNKRVADYLSYRNGVIDALKTMGDRNEFVVAYDYAYRKFHDFKDPVTSHSISYILRNTDVVELDGQLVTRDIQQRINNFAPICLSTGCNLSLSDRDRLSLISFDDNVTTTEVADPDSDSLLRKLVSYKHDGSVYREEHDNRVILCEETELGIQLDHMFREFRSAIDFL